jgi:hypothetical protein
MTLTAAVPAAPTAPAPVIHTVLSGRKATGHGQGGRGCACLYYA